MGRILLWIVEKVLAGTVLSLNEKNLLTGLLLAKVSALPLHDIITTSESGAILINGLPIDLDKARVLRENAISALNNQSLKLVHERVMWNAVKSGLQRGLPPEDMLFFRAAIWFGEQQLQMLRELSGKQELPLSED